MSRKPELNPPPLKQPLLHRPCFWLLCAAAASLVASLFMWMGDSQNLSESSPGPVAARGARAEADLAKPDSPSKPASTADGGPREMEVCGFGAQKLVPGIGLQANLDAREQAAHAKAVLRMRASGNERAVALAAWLSASNLLAQSGSDDACGSAGCAAKAKTGAMAEINQFLNAARDTKDAYVFSVARHACQQTAQRCTEFSVERLVELDPENGNAWLMVAQEADRRGQIERRNGALFRAAHAQRFDSDHSETIRLVQSALGGGTSDLEVLDDALVGMLAQGAASQISIPTFGGLTGLCNPESGKPAPHCRLIAQRMVDRSETMIGLGVGYSLGKSIGLSTKADQEMRDKVDSLYYAATQAEIARPSNDASNSLSCESIKAEAAQLRALAALGEIAYFEQELAKSGLTTEQAAKRWRAHMQQLTAKLDVEEQKRQEAAKRNPF